MSSKNRYSNGSVVARDGVDCNEEQHQFNRRTEVVIRKMKEDSSVRIIKAQ